MNCPRCSGRMVHEDFHGLEDEYAWSYPGFRCIHCGEVVDRVIMSNRQAGGCVISS